MRGVGLAALLLAGLAAPARASARLPDAIEPLASAGFKAMYRHDFALAEQKFREMSAVLPGHPAGPMFLASLYWWQYSNEFEKPDPELEKKFFAAAYKGIELAKDWKTGGGRNLEADFWLGGAYGLIGRWHVSQFEWIRAYLNGKRGYNYLRSVYRKDPGNHDAALGVGEFEYLASRLPGLVRITALLFVRGDREGGIRACTEAAEKGTFTTTEAKLFLAAIYSEQLHEYDKALQWMDSLLADDPGNEFFLMGRGIVRFYKRDFETAAREIGDSLRRLEGRPGEPLRALLPMGYYHLGVIALLQKRYDEAESWFTRAVQDSEHAERGWVTNCLLRRGQARDVQGRRAEALEDYAAVLKRPNFWDTRKFARRHQNAPASLADVLGQIYGDKAVEYERHAD